MIDSRSVAFAGPLIVLMQMGVLLAGAEPEWKPAPGPLMTRWAAEVSPANVLPEYPRPQLVRSAWMNLNGLWDLALTAPEAPSPGVFLHRILVPFPWESALSGIGLKSAPDQRLWYRRTFAVPSAWAGKRILLHFGAVNWDSTVAVNGRKVGAHRGGYDAYTCDVTEALRLHGDANELVVSAWNPLRIDVAEAQVLGKQRQWPMGIFYTAATGIWQTVWLEPVPSVRIAGLRIIPDLDGKAFRITVDAPDAAPAKVRITVSEGSTAVAEFTTSPGVEARIPLAVPRAWSPTDPYLYGLTVDLLREGVVIDTVESYAALRKIALGQDAKGRTCIALNNAPLLQIGVLDQGYWPDGIYTAPTDAALRSDIETAKRLGFNLLRKHSKVESARWYHWTDRLGMLVWQDMPQMFGRDAGANLDKELSVEAKRQFTHEWQRIITQLANAPSIVAWTTFNEGWGQHDTVEVVTATRALDPTRLIGNASGWTDRQVGDLVDSHNYEGPGSQKPEAARAAVCGEFGGLALDIAGHTWPSDVLPYGSVRGGIWRLTRKYQELMRKAYDLNDQVGTSVFVYTQLTDVETEVNGMLTYDRALLKVDQAIVVAANQGRFSDMPARPVEPPDLVPTAREAPQAWRYTMTKPADGWNLAMFDDAAWMTGAGSFGQGYGGLRTHWESGDIWLRREVTLPSLLPARLQIIMIHDEDAEIWLNGVLACSVPGFRGEYIGYPLTPAARAALVPGRNVIAVHCHQTAGGQIIDIGIAEIQEAAGP